MNKYFIVSKQGLLKLYYSEDAAASQSGSFSTSVRNAKSFENLDDAKRIIADNELKDCDIVNQLGVIQK